MNIIKTIVVEFSKLAEDWDNWAFDYEQITVRTAGHTVTDTKTVIVFYAEKALIKLPLKTKSNLISVPHLELKELEQVLENIINVISFSEAANRQITSTIPSIFLSPTNEKEKKYLSEADGFDFGKKPRLQSTIKLKFDLDLCLKNLGDRFDGFRIISEANNTNNLSGKFHEYIRLFERAFKKANKHLIDPLARFLMQNEEMGYSLEEVRNWMGVRHKSIHSDQKEIFFVESDIRPYIYRVQQACYEVLFNKEKWRSPSIDRKVVYKIPAGTKSSSNDKFIVKGTPLEIVSEVLDESHSYKINFKVRLNPLPENWWAPNPNEVEFKGSSVKILKNEEEE